MRTVEQILKEQLGNLMFQNAFLASELEAAKEQIKELLDKLQGRKERTDV